MKNWTYTKLLIGIYLVPLIGLLVYKSFFTPEEEPTITPYRELEPSVVIDYYEGHLDFLEPIPKEIITVDRQTNYSAFSGDASTVVYSGHKLSEWDGTYVTGKMVYNFPLYGQGRMNEVFYLDGEYGPLNVIAWRKDQRDMVGSIVELKYEDETKMAIILDICGGCEIVATNGENETRIDFYTAYLDYDNYDIGYQYGWGKDNANIEMTIVRKGW